MEKFQLIFFKRRRLNVSGLVKCSFHRGGGDCGGGREEKKGENYKEIGEEMK